MSTRATIHFCDGCVTEHPEVIAYRHGDGYPTSLGRDLIQFLKDVNEQCEKFIGGKRFGEPAALAAKWIIQDALRSSLLQERIEKATKEGMSNKKVLKKITTPSQPLRFMSVYIMAQDPPDIEYRYQVECHGNGFDDKMKDVKIICEAVYPDEHDNIVVRKKMTIFSSGRIRNEKRFEQF